MGLIFTLPFVGFVLGWFLVGVFLTAPVSTTLFRTNLAYGASQLAMLLSGLVILALLVALEARLSARLQNMVLKFGASALIFVMSVFVGFAGPFLVLSRFAAGAG